jgi:hemoglobin/transferrin/lactoferrin receptor protein
MTRSHTTTGWTRALRPRLTTAVALLTGALSAAAHAQETASPDTTYPDTTRQRVHELAAVTVTATRTPKSVIETPAPVTVIDRSRIRERTPNTISDLFRSLPGLDVTGVGPNQTRPSIRNQRGQRILVLEDGLRLNNSRRQQDFGEIPGLVDVSRVERVEVVRGPSSVLYGSDAIGGVVNIITQTPQDEGLHGAANYSYGTAAGENRVTGDLSGRFGRFSFLAGGNFRNAGQYEAPSGTFGEITLDNRTKVLDTGLEDYGGDAYAAYDLTRNQRVFAKYAGYRADTAGFGWVDPAAYAPDEPTIQILYPFQDFDKVTAGYRGSNLGTAAADRLGFTAYYQRNQRQLTNNIFIPFGPGQGLAFNTDNYTDIDTYGFRLEASKLVGSSVLVTYGADYFRDHSENADTSITTMVGFGPPMPDTSTVPLVPYATLQNVGVFAQGDLALSNRVSLILGARYQSVRAATRSTPGRPDEDPISETDQTFVAAANAIVDITDNLSVIGTVGRGFRAPNLVERFFNGPTPEGGGYQVPNTELEPERSLNVDLGLRFATSDLYLEGFVFRNQINDGIRIAATGDSISQLPTFTNVNVDRLRFTGLELTGNARLPLGLSLRASYTHFDTKDVNDPENPVGDSFSDKIAASLRYTYPGELFFVEYDVRHNGDRKEVDLGTSPVGPVLPAFTVHNVRAMVTVFSRGSHRHRLGVTMTNLTDALYAEFSNAAFFRPEARRGVRFTWDMAF